jgi:hypothetical protein
VRWLHTDPSRWDELEKAATLFRSLWAADIPHIAIENPIPHKYAVERIGSKYTQIIQPWMFGHTETKATCLWLKGLPNLEPTSNLKEETMNLPNKERHRIHWASPGPERSMVRSKTFQGIADAMALQWNDPL